MNTQLLLEIACALALAHFIQVLFETSQVRKKVTRLQTYMNGKKYKEMPININTRAKSYGISLLGFIGFFALSYFIFWLLKPTLTAGLVEISVLLIISYAWVAFDLDRYHVAIETVTKKFKK